MSPTTKAEPKLIAEFIAPADSYETIIAQQKEKALNKLPTAFKVRAQHLDQGRTDSVLAASDGLTVRLKVYASGGENALHAHANEDHVFILLQGCAEFSDADGVLASLQVNEGLLVPKGAYYCFNATGTEPLVMLRIGSPNESALGLEGRVDTLGTFAHADAAANKTVPVKFRAASFFG